MRLFNHNKYEEISKNSTVLCFTSKNIDNEFNKAAITIIKHNRQCFISGFQSGKTCLTELDKNIWIKRKKNIL